ncbi:MAG: PPOX class F420-dependent oxidoreductase [Actinobacteria bacterium]|nr:PPOX class F420-dependent oxidoreductase [Actinomycetota bacterium]
MDSRLEQIRPAGTILLTTYKRDGTPVRTAVSLAFDHDRAFFRSYDEAWKTKRLRRNPAVSVAPCTFRGRVTGPELRGTARLLDGDQARIAARALARRHPVLQGAVVPVLHRVMRYHTKHYELEP